MKTAFAIAATLSLALTACERAPADGSSEEPATENEAPLNPSVPGDEPTVTAADYDGPMPIRIGTNGPEMDSCASYGEVSGLEDAGETYLSVRDAPLHGHSRHARPRKRTLQLRTVRCKNVHFAHVPHGIDFARNLPQKSDSHQSLRSRKRSARNIWVWGMCLREGK